MHNIQFLKYFQPVNYPTPINLSGTLDYSPFGTTLEGRSWSAGSEYRYGFNGMENDDEISGNDNALDFGERIYDSRLGRWFSIDKLSPLYPEMSAYSSSLNNPIFLKDIGGDKVVVYWSYDKNNNPILNIEISGIIINNSGNTLNDPQIFKEAMLEFQSEMNQIYNNYSGESFSVNVELDFRYGVAEDIKPDDHTIYLVYSVNDLDGNGDGILDDVPARVNWIGGRIAYFEVGGKNSHLFDVLIENGPHEFGHWLGLLHPPMTNFNRYYDLDNFMRWGNNFSADWHQMFAIKYFADNNYLNQGPNIGPDQNSITVNNDMCATNEYDIDPNFHKKSKSEINNQTYSKKKGEGSGIYYKQKTIELMEKIYTE